MIQSVERGGEIANPVSKLSDKYLPGIRSGSYAAPSAQATSHQTETGDQHRP